MYAASQACMSTNDGLAKAIIGDGHPMSHRSRCVALPT